MILQRFSFSLLQEQFWHVVHPAFPLLTAALPTLQGALKDCFGDAVMECDMPEPCKFPFLDSCRKRKGVDLAPHPVIGLVLQLGDADSKQILQNM